MKLSVSIMTPQNKVHAGEADEVVIPTSTGEIGVLPNHVSLVTRILPGEVRIKNGDKLDYFAIMGGYAEINNNNVNILGDYAVRAQDIEVAKAEAAKARAEKIISEKLSREDFATIEAELRKSLLELKVAKRRRSS